MMKEFLARHQKVVAFSGAVVAAVIAGVYIVVLPEEATESDGVVRLLLVYGHSLCWVLLSAASVVWGVRGKNVWSVVCAYGALVAYGGFFGALMISRFL